jgi:hypothetical protein
MGKKEGAMKGRGMFHKVRLLMYVVGVVALVIVMAIWVSKVTLSEAQPPPQAGQEVKVVDENGTIVFGANSAKVEVTNLPAAQDEVKVIDENGNTVFGANSAKVEVTNPVSVEVTNFPANDGGGAVFTLFGVDFCPAGSTLVIEGDTIYVRQRSTPGGVGGAFCNVGVLSTFEELVVMGPCVVCKF